MLEEQDFKKIREAVKEEIGDALEVVVLPRFEGLEGRMDGLEIKIDGLEGRIIKIESEMVTKSYLDDKLADLEGAVITRQRKEDKRFNLLVEFLQKKQILGESEIKMLKEFKIFPEMNLN